MEPQLSYLRDTIQSHPLFDNHAHNLLNKESATDFDTYPLEAIARTTLSLIRATNQLGELYDSPCINWDNVQSSHERWVREDYEGLIRRSLKGTSGLLLDDTSLDEDDIQSYEWHDNFTSLPTKRIVQIEAMAESQMLAIASSERKAGESVWDNFRQRFQNALSKAMDDPLVAGFSSAICHRTGFDVDPYSSDNTTLAGSLVRTLDSGTTRSGFRVEDKQLCDWLVQQTLKAISFKKKAGGAKPLQFLAGLGDKEVNLVRANPAYLQPLIAQYPDADIVILHSAYPYTREAGYLASVYPNVYLDLGRVFPMVGREAQERILRESLELTPTDRLLWSTGGCFHPETFWLANLQFRKALETVLVGYVQHGDLSISQGTEIALDILFHNSKRLYKLTELPGWESPTFE